MTEHSADFKRFRLQLFAATWLSYAGFYVCRRVYPIIKQPLKENYGFTDSDVAYPWTIYLITYMLGQFVAAWLGRRMESKRVLIYGMAIAAGCNVILGALVDLHAASLFFWMCVVMGIHGFAQATGWSHNVAMFANWTRRAERGVLFGLWGTCYQIGSIVGKALAAFFLGWLGMAWSFFGSSLVLFALTLVFAYLATEKPASVGLTLDDDAEPDVPADSAGPGLKESAPLPPGFVGSIIAMGLIYFGFKFVRYALDSWSALIIGEHFKMPAEMAGYWSVAFDAIGFIGVVAGGIWSDRIQGARRAPVIFWMTIGCLVFTSLMWWVGLSSPVFFIVLLGLIGLTAMGPDSLLSGASAMDVGSRRQAALAAGVINGLGSIGPILQEPVIAVLKHDYGLSSVFLLLVIVVFCAAIGTGLLALYGRRV